MMQVLANVMVVIMWQHVSVLNQHVVHLKTPTTFYVNDLSIKLEKKERKLLSPLCAVLQGHYLHFPASSYFTPSFLSYHHSSKLSPVTEDPPLPGAENIKMKGALSPLSMGSGDRWWASGQVISAQLTPPAVFLSLGWRARWVFWSRDGVGRGECYTVPGAGPVKTCNSEQYYTIMSCSPRVWRCLKNACIARPLHSSQGPMWVPPAPCQHQKKKKQPERQSSDLSSLVVWCHQAVSVISTPLETGKETGEEGGDGTPHGDAEWSPWPHPSVVCLPIPGSLCLILKLRCQCCLKETKPGMATNLVLVLVLVLVFPSYSQK